MVGNLYTGYPILNEYSKRVVINRSHFESNNASSIGVIYIRHTSDSINIS